MTIHMENDKWYDLAPPSVINGKKYHKVRCWYKVPNQENEYVVRGTPDGHDDEESFVLRFTDKGVKVTPSKPSSHLKVVN